MAIEKIILALFFFNIAFWRYIYIDITSKKKKAALECH
jgi:hypothetical protein